MEWITPKTDWTRSDYFTYEDYNRIRNNLLYLNEKLNGVYPEKYVELDLGEPKTGYGDKYYPSEFNAFENALESFTRVGENVNLGDIKVFKGNDPFITYDELNRIEKCCLRWYDYNPATVEEIIPSETNITLGRYKSQLVSISFNPPQAATSNFNWRTSNSNIRVYKESDNVLRIFGDYGGSAKVYLECDEAEAEINVTIVNTAVAIWLNSKQGGNGNEELGGIGIGLGRTRNVYAVTDARDAIDRYEYEYHVTDPSIISVEKDKDKMALTGLKKGRCKMYLTLKDLRSSVDCEVYVQ